MCISKVCARKRNLFLSILPNGTRVIARIRVEVDENRAKHLLPPLSIAQSNSVVHTSIMRAEKRLSMKNQHALVHHYRLLIIVQIIANRLTAKEVAPACDVRSCLIGPPARNSSPGITTQNPMRGLVELIQPCTWLSLLSHEY